MTHPPRLANKTILVTGAGSGMGRVATRIFASHGANVVASDLNEAGLQQTIDEAGDELSAQIVPVVGSVTIEDDVRRIVAEGSARFGTINVLYNNAGIMPEADTSVVDTDPDLWDTVQNVNVKSIFLICKHTIPQMIDAGGGSIVNIASFVALIGCTNPQDAYTASKGAVISLTRSLAVQYGRIGIRANAICPGPILTPMTEQLFPNEEEKMKRFNRIPLGRFGRAEDIVNAGVFLASDESSWMTGTQFVVDGGITINYF
jgi:NAD(P)-dependent dehydrogenase (short-subunit alcohol dehydrogenase family)